MFEQRWDLEVSRLQSGGGSTTGAAISALGQPAQLHRVRLPGLHLRTDALVRRMLASEVLGIKRAKGSPDCRADSYDAFFYVWSKKGNPQITPDKQLWAPHRRWASWMLDAIVLHLLGGRCCIVHHAMSAARRMTVLIHLPLQNAFVREAGCEFLFPPWVSGRSDFHRCRNPPCARLSA